MFVGSVTSATIQKCGHFDSRNVQATRIHCKHAANTVQPVHTTPTIAIEILQRLWRSITEAFGIELVAPLGMPLHLKWNPPLFNLPRHPYCFGRISRPRDDYRITLLCAFTCRNQLALPAVSCCHLANSENGQRCRNRR